MIGLLSGLPRPPAGAMGRTGLPNNGAERIGATASGFLGIRVRGAGPRGLSNC